MLAGAEHVVIQGVMHQPGGFFEGALRQTGAQGEAAESDDGDQWYGSRSVVALWAPLLVHK